MNTDYRKAKYDTRPRSLSEIRKASNIERSRSFSRLTHFPVHSPTRQEIERDELEKAKEQAKYMSDDELNKAREQARKYLTTK